MRWCFRSKSHNSMKRQTVPSFRPSAKMVGRCKLIHKVNSSHSFVKSFYKPGVWKEVLELIPLCLCKLEQSCTPSLLDRSKTMLRLTFHFTQITFLEYWQWISPCFMLFLSGSVGIILQFRWTVLMPYIPSSNNFAIKVELLKK